jgi:hypothetical protein
MIQKKAVVCVLRRESDVVDTWSGVVKVGAGHVGMYPAKCRSAPHTQQGRSLIGPASCS